VEITSYNAARVFGLYPRKGIIAEGADADIVIWDPDIKKTISAKTHHMHCDSDIFEGFEISGAARHVITNGKVAIYNGKRTNKEIKGSFLKRTRQQTSSN
jgi:dihydropyrimidinase